MNEKIKQILELVNELEWSAAYDPEAESCEGLIIGTEEYIYSILEDDEEEPVDDIEAHNKRTFGGGARRLIYL